MASRLFQLLSLLLFVSVAAVYANHFDNSFHFDDSHAVEQNVYIRSLANIPRMFVDARTVSNLPANQSYRPLLTASLAISYWLGGGLHPLYFHAWIFTWYLIQLLLMYFLFKQLMDRADPNASNNYAALFAVAIYALHPVSAETINYIVQQADLLSTLSVIAALLLYISRPQLQKYGCYLLLVVLGALVKPPAIMFAPIFLIYVLLFENDSGLEFWHSTFAWQKLRSAILKSAPAFAVCACCYFLQRALTSASFTPGGTSTAAYLITQPYIHFHYFCSFFLPIALSADTDQTVLPGLLDPHALLGFAFLLTLAAAILYTSRKLSTRPIAFGLAWFLIALVPTSVVPLAEVANDHRMFFPFVGLSLAIPWTGILFIRKQSGTTVGQQLKRAIPVAACLLLPIYAWGTYQRNEVWNSEETLWADAVQKSPKNGRALMNYGLSQMGVGRYEQALAQFTAAQKYTPNYSNLEVNLGIVQGELNHTEQAEQHFKRAMLLSPNQSIPFYFYARYLNTQKRNTEALAMVRLAIRKVPEDFQSRYLNLKILFENKEWLKLKTAITENLQIAPFDTTTLQFAEKASVSEKEELRLAEERVNARPSAPDFLNLSFAYYRSGRFDDCINAARRALEINPSYAEAYNNIGSAYAARNDWDNAIDAASAALAIKPDMKLAQNNLSWAKSQKEKTTNRQISLNRTPQLGNP